MSDLLTAMASDILKLLQVGFLVSLRVLAFILIVFLGLVLAKLTAGCFLLVLSAAPPHLTTPVGLMGATGPVVILLFEILLTALLTYLLVVFNAEPLVLKLGDSLLQLVSLHLELLALLNLSVEVIFNFFIFISQFLGNLCLLSETALSGVDGLILAFDLDRLNFDSLPQVLSR